MPPSVAELERRLRTRATDSEDVIRRRLGQALDDMSHWAEFGFVVVNERLDEAVDGLIAILGGDGSRLASTERRHGSARQRHRRQIAQGPRISA